MRWVRTVAAVTLILVAAALSFSIYLAHTEGGARLLVAMVYRVLGGNATVGSVQGALNDGLVLTNVTYRDPAAGVDVRLARAVVEIELRALAVGRLRFRNIDAYGLVVALHPAPDRAESTDPLSLPIDVDVVRLNLVNGELQRAGKPAMPISNLELRAQWRGQRVVVQSAVLVTSSGTLSVSGELLTSEPFVHRLESRLQWRQGDRVVAGAVTARSAQGSIHIIGELTAPVAARLEGAVEVSPTLNWAVEVSVPAFNPRRQLFAASPIQEASAELRVRGDLDSAHMSGHLMLADKRVDLRASGQFAASGDSAHLTSTGTMESLVRGRTAEASWKISVADRRAEVEELTLRYGGGRLSAQGHVARVSHLQWQLAVTGERFDPGMFSPLWPGSIDLSLVTAGQFESTGPKGTIQVEHLSGVLRDRPLSGSGSLRLSPDEYVGRLQFRSADAQLLITGERGTSDSLLAELRVPALSEWFSPLSGALTMRMKARGRWPQVSIGAEAHANAVEYEQIKAADVRLALTMRNPKHPSGRIDIRAQDVAISDVTFSSIQALLSGSEHDHSFDVRATGDPATIVASVRGALARHAWSASISQLQLDVADFPRVSLRAPATLDLTKTSVSLSESCLVGGQAELCLTSNWRKRGAASLTYSIRQLPLGLIAQFAAAVPNLVVEGALDGQGDVEREANGELHGSAQLSSLRGRVSYTPDKAASLEYTDVELKVSFDGATARGNVAAKFAPEGEIVATASLDDLRASDPSLQGKGSLRSVDLGLFAALMPQLRDLQGRAEAAFTVAGSLHRPQVVGNISVTALQSEVPSLGLRLHDGSISVVVEPPGPARLSGRISSGSGVLEVDGFGDSIGDFELRINGSDVTAVDLPGAHGVIAPQLEVSRKSQITALSGTLTVPRADVDLDLLLGHSPRRASSDVVLVDRARNVEATAASIHADVDVVLGDSVKLKGAGFDGQLSGRVRVLEAADRPSTGSGEIDVAGTYELYGRRLTIESARLLYAGTPLDDPQLDVLATRELPDATIQVRVTGTAQRPKLALSADDGDMTQTEALAYLLTGKPPEELRQEDGAMLQSAKDSLGTMFGDRLARSVGSKLGLDDVGVEQSAELGASALTIGKYLSPRLFVSYGVGLFEPGRVVTIRYRINKSFAVEANRSTESQHAGIEYRVER